MTQPVRPQHKGGTSATSGLPYVVGLLGGLVAFVTFLLSASVHDTFFDSWPHRVAGLVILVAGSGFLYAATRWLQAPPDASKRGLTIVAISLVAGVAVSAIYASATRTGASTTRTGGPAIADVVDPSFPKEQTYGLERPFLGNRIFVKLDSTAQAVTTKVTIRTTTPHTCEYTIQDAVTGEGTVILINNGDFDFRVFVRGITTTGAAVQTLAHSPATTNASRVCSGTYHGIDIHSAQPG